MTHTLTFNTSSRTAHTFWLTCRGSRLYFGGAQRRPEDAKPEALRALDSFEKLGAVNDGVSLHGSTVKEIDDLVIRLGESFDGRELLETVLLVVGINCSRDNRIRPTTTTLASSSSDITAAVPYLFPLQGRPLPDAPLQSHRFIFVVPPLVVVLHASHISMSLASYVHLIASL